MSLEGLRQRTLRVVPKMDAWKTPTQIMHESVEGLCAIAHANSWARRHMMAWELSSAENSTGTMKLEAVVRDLIIAWAR